MAGAWNVAVLNLLRDVLLISQKTFPLMQPPVTCTGLATRASAEIAGREETGSWFWGIQNYFNF